MAPLSSSAIAATFISLFLFSNAASNCPTTLTPKSGIKPVAASGYHFAVVATGLTKPRSLHFDGAGNLLVVQAGAGIERLELADHGGVCVTESSRSTVVSNTGLNHGMALSPDGEILYSSSSELAYSWTYNDTDGTTANQKTLISGMNTDDHTTRTLTLSEKHPGMLMVSRGSTSNIDPAAGDITSGHSQIKAFDLSSAPNDGFQFNPNGALLAWGLRNSVGVAEHPTTGGIYAVENSCDDFKRDGTDVHQDNPGEEMNYLGHVQRPNGNNYGYPDCFTAWDVSEIPNNSALKVGSQFANASSLDQICTNRTAPRLTFQAHMAPLDIKFNSSGTQAWVTFHGSWDRTNPVGYKLSLIHFANGEPVAPATSNTSTTDILTNANNAACPGNCFRPAGIAFDSQGRLFMSSDASGEIYVVVADQKASKKVKRPIHTPNSHSPPSAKRRFVEGHGRKEGA